MKSRSSRASLSNTIYLTLGCFVVVNGLTAGFTWGQIPDNIISSPSPPSSDSSNVGNIIGRITAESFPDPSKSTTEFQAPAKNLQNENLQNSSLTSVPSDSLNSVPVYGQVSNQANDLLAVPLNPETAEDGNTVSDGAPSENERGRLNIPFGQGNFRYGFGSIIPAPTALVGPTRDLPVSAQATGLSVISVTTHLQQKLAEDQFLLLELIGDPQQFGFDVSYTTAPDSLPGVFSFNFFNQRALNSNFENGKRDVNLPNGATPWVDRIGGGIEYRQTFSPQFNVAFALNYQQIAVRDAAFTSNLATIDQLGNPVTVSPTGQDTILNVAAVGFLDEVTGQLFNREGTRVQFGLYQAIPVGASDIFYNRVIGNVSQFIPLRLFTSEPGTLVLNLQGGGTFGEVPPYEALSLGGGNSVRGFATGDVGSARSFIQVTAEYRFPLFALELFNTPLKVGGVTFVDYGSDLGTGSSVIGTPAVAREKPGEGLGYGLGFQLGTPIGLLRLEYGFNNQGGSAFHFVIGDRF